MTTDTNAAEQQVHRPSAWQRFVLRTRRVNLTRLLVVALLALSLGVAGGRFLVPDGQPDALAAIQRSGIPHALDADGIWTSSVDDDPPPVTEGLDRLRNAEGADARVAAWAVDWLSAYDQALIRLAGSDLPPEARPVQRQLIGSVTLSRDAVEVLGHAAEAEDDGVREALLTEALRLRQRSEHLAQAARASVRDLEGSVTEVSRYPEDLPQLPPMD